MRPGFLSHLSPENEVWKYFFSGKRGQPGLCCSEEYFKKRKGRDRTTDTFQNVQPCRVMRIPDRIARQAGILPSVIKRHISQLKNFHFLVRGVKASSLENKGSRPNKAQEGNGTMSKEFWKRKRSVLLLGPTPSAQKVKHQKILQTTLSGRALQYLLVEKHGQVESVLLNFTLGHTITT